MACPLLNARGKAAIERHERATGFGAGNVRAPWHYRINGLDAVLTVRQPLRTPRSIRPLDAVRETSLAHSGRFAAAPKPSAQPRPVWRFNCGGAETRFSRTSRSLAMGRTRNEHVGAAEAIAHKHQSVIAQLWLEYRRRNRV